MKRYLSWQINIKNKANWSIYQKTNKKATFSLHTEPNSQKEKNTSKNLSNNLKNHSQNLKNSLTIYKISISNYSKNNNQSSQSHKSSTKPNDIPKNKCQTFTSKSILLNKKYQNYKEKNYKKKKSSTNNLIGLTKNKIMNNSIKI